MPELLLDERLYAPAERFERAASAAPDAVAARARWRETRALLARLARQS